MDGDHTSRRAIAENETYASQATLHSLQLLFVLLSVQTSAQRTATRYTAKRQPKRPSTILSHPAILKGQPLLTCKSPECILFVFVFVLLKTKDIATSLQIQFFSFPRFEAKGFAQATSEREGMEAQHEVLVPEVRLIVSASPTFPDSSPKSSGSRTESKLLGFVPSFLWGGHQHTDIEISNPSGFRHTSSISYNTTEGGFTLRNIPTEWKKLFKSAPPALVCFLSDQQLPMQM